MGKRIWVLTGIVALAALTRLVPHPPNITPIAAMALFGGAYYGKRVAAYLVPLAAMFVSDLLLGWFVYGHSILGSQWVVYACIVATVAMGRLIYQRRSPLTIVSVTLASSVMFYLVTNFAVWAFGTLYPKTAEGLVACYGAAIPFFRNSLVGDLAYSTLLFGGFVILERLLPMLREEPRLLAA